VLNGQIERYFGFLNTNNEKHGRGIMINRFGELYEGWFANNEPNGPGRLI
jgi:hypothetical protein